VDQGSQRQVTFTYTLANGLGGNSATAKFAVTGPSGLQVTGPTGVPDVFQSSTNGPSKGFVILLNYGIQATAKAANPQGAQGGSFSWVQLLTAENWTYREGGPFAGSGVVGCVPSFFAQDPSPELDSQYPTAAGFTFQDAPATYGLQSAYVGDVAGEEKASKSFSTYLMWNPNLQGSIPVPLGSVSWQYACDAVNALTGQSNNTTWTLACATPQTPGSVQFSPGTSYPQWTKVAANGSTDQSCQYQ